jgi:hypothetical protein
VKNGAVLRLLERSTAPFYEELPDMEVTSTRLPTESTASDAAPVLSRIDPPHPVSEPSAVEAASEESAPVESVEPAEDPIVVAVTGRSAEHLPDQLHSQALQLGSYLRAKQQELDRREALMNAREAKLENELRLARMWVRERGEEDREREADYSARKRSLDEQAALIAAAELFADRDALR